MWLTKIHKGSNRIITTLEEGQLLQMEAIMSEGSDKLYDVIELLLLFHRSISSTWKLCRNGANIPIYFIIKIKSC